MNKVKEVLEVLGLEVGVEYKCVGFRGIYKINNSGALLINHGKGFDYGENMDLIDVISGKIVLTPMPFKPKDNEQFYLVLLDGTTRYSSFSINDMYDFYAVNTGNCFKTREEAEANKDMILAMFEKMRNGEYGNE